MIRMRNYLRGVTHSMGIKHIYSHRPILCGGQVCFPITVTSGSNSVNKIYKIIQDVWFQGLFERSSHVFQGL